MTDGKPERQYWDASVICVLFTAATNEEERRTICTQLLAAAEAEDIEVVTSALTIAEVTGGRRASNDPAVLNGIMEFFRQPFIRLQNVDRTIAIKAHEIRVDHHRRGTSLKGNDAIHLATALLTPGLDRMFTYDEGDLVRLSGTYMKHDGSPLAITLPIKVGQISFFSDVDKQ